MVQPTDSGTQTGKNSTCVAHKFKHLNKTFCVSLNRCEFHDKAPQLVTEAYEGRSLISISKKINPYNHRSSITEQ